MGGQTTGRVRVQPAGLNPWDSLEQGYAEAILIGSRLVMSGQISLAATFEDQIREIVAKIRRIVEEAGGSLADLVDLTIFSTVPYAWQTIRPLLWEAGINHAPCVTLIGTPHLSHPAMLIEIKAEAVLGSSVATAES